uniref:Solute carrier family 35 member G1 n=2 Tax=Homininae TaxID=207598 RepID=A0A2I3TDB8_PANTR
MRPQDSTGVAELQEPGLPLTDDAPPGATEEPAAAEAAGAPDRGRCWLCLSSPCCSRTDGATLRGS